MVNQNFLKLISILFLFLSCSTPPKSFNTSLKKLQCEKAMEEIPQSKIPNLILHKASDATKTGVKFALIGGAKTIDVLALTTGALVFCIPDLLLAVAFHSGFDPYHRPGKCVFNPKIIELDLARKVEKLTRGFFCTTGLKSLISHVQKVNHCLENRSLPGDDEKRKQNLETLLKVAYRQDYGCIDRHLVVDLERKLELVSPSNN